MSPRFSTRTETPHDAHAGLDLYSTQDIAAAFVDDQFQAVQAARAAAPDIARAVDAALPRIRGGGRLIYVGAGTSGRLGLLDSVELMPTFSWEGGRAMALLAGGPDAVFRSVEGAEDDAEQGRADLLGLSVTRTDVVILLAASGSTPYALGALQAALDSGALTVGIANNPGAELSARAEIGITLDTGPEVISGSTRLKAGTAQKIALNTFSSTLMVRLNKVYGNLMVDVRASNAKLRRRCINLTALTTGVSELEARVALEACGFHVKTAIVMIRRGLSAEASRTLLEQVDGSVRAALSA